MSHDTALAVVATRHGSTTRLPGLLPWEAIPEDPKGAVEALEALCGYPLPHAESLASLLADGRTGFYPFAGVAIHVDGRGRSWWRTLRASEVRAVRAGTPLPAGVWTVYNRTRPLGTVTAGTETEACEHFTAEGATHAAFVRVAVSP